MTLEDYLYGIEEERDGQNSHGGGEGAVHICSSVSAGQALRRRREFRRNHGGCSFSLRKRNVRCGEESTPLRCTSCRYSATCAFCSIDEW